MIMTEAIKCDSHVVPNHIPHGVCEEKASENVGVVSCIAFLFLLQKLLKIGGFTLKDEPPSSSLSIGSLFMKRTHSSPSPSSSTSVSLAAAARDASSSLSGGSSKAPTSSFGPTGHSVAKKPTDVPTSLTKSKSEVMADKEKTQKTVHTEVN